MISFYIIVISSLRSAFTQNSENLERYPNGNSMWRSCTISWEFIAHIGKKYFIFLAYLIESAPIFDNQFRINNIRVKCFDNMLIRFMSRYTSITTISV